MHRHQVHLTSLRKNELEKKDKGTSKNRFMGDCIVNPQPKHPLNQPTQPPPPPPPQTTQLKGLLYAEVASNLKNDKRANMKA